MSNDLDKRIADAVAKALALRGTRKAVPAQETEAERVFRVTGLQRGSFRGRVLDVMLSKGPGVYTAAEIHKSVPGIDFANIAASFKHISFVLERSPCGYSLGFAGRNENSEARFSSDAPKAARKASEKRKSLPAPATPKTEGDVA